MVSDLTDEKQVVEFIRDLVNCYPTSADAKLAELRKRLKAIGWDEKTIESLEAQGCFGTRYEAVLPQLYNW